MDVLIWLGWFKYQAIKRTGMTYPDFLLNNDDDDDDDDSHSVIEMCHIVAIHFFILNEFALFFFNALPCKYLMPGSCPALCLNLWMNFERISALPGWITLMYPVCSRILPCSNILWYPQFKATVNIPDTSCPERYVPLLSLLPRTTIIVFIQYIFGI